MAKGLGQYISETELPGEGAFVASDFSRGKKRHFNGFRIQINLKDYLTVENKNTGKC